MPLNKFGIRSKPFGKRSETELYNQWNEFRNYVRDNTLCVVAVDFNAKSRKIRRVALPIDDGNAANKRYVQQSMQILKDRQDKIERKIRLLQSSANISLNYIQQKKHANL